MSTDLRTATGHLDPITKENELGRINGMPTMCLLVLCRVLILLSID